MIRLTTMKHLACLTLAGPGAIAAAAERPNIIYIFTDQQTAQAMSCAGNLDVQTPNIDRLAAEGVRFENAYCTSPLSGPSRGAMFTGYYPGAVGLAVNGAPMPEALKGQTLGTLVKNAGYDCAYGGKWHLPLLDIPHQEYGFDQMYPHSDDGLAEACAEYISQKRKRPFFLVASFDNPHNICEYARRQNLPYGNLPDANIRDWPGLPPNFAKNPYDADVIEHERTANYNVYPTANFTPDEWRLYRHTYFTLVEKIDKEIGKIVDAIDRGDLWKNTIVIFSSDHGDGIGAHHWNQKSALYEEVINIPFIVTLPGGKHAGTVLPQLINNGIDLFATICDWTGAKLPAGAPGKSFREIVEAGCSDLEHQDHIIIETQFDGSKTRGWAVRSEDYKYVLYDKGKYREQLFDMVNDRGETRNLALERKYDQVLQRHRDLLEQWMNQQKIRPTRPALHDVPGAVLPGKKK